jgi:hypothetical protein
MEIRSLLFQPPKKELRTLSSEYLKWMAGEIQLIHTSGHPNNGPRVLWSEAGSLKHLKIEKLAQVTSGPSRLFG